MTRVHVAAGVIWDRDRAKVLLSKRLEKAHQGGLWEFPGGKVEAQESAPDALARELEEELGIAVVECSPLIQVSHDYRDKKVLLDVWLVSEFSGLPEGREGQQLYWADRAELLQLEFPAANDEIVKVVVEFLKGKGNL